MGKISPVENIAFDQSQNVASRKMAFAGLMGGTASGVGLVVHVVACPVKLAVAGLLSMGLGASATYYLSYGLWTAVAASCLMVMCRADKMWVRGVAGAALAFTAVTGINSHGTLNDPAKLLTAEGIAEGANTTFKEIVRQIDNVCGGPR